MKLLCKGLPIKGLQNPYIIEKQKQTKAKTTLQF